jgi:hypothetical protein
MPTMPLATGMGTRTATAADGPATVTAMRMDRTSLHPREHCGPRSR